MEYMENMEVIDSNMMETVLGRAAAYDYKQYTAADVRHALSQDSLSVEDLAALLSPAAFPFLEEMAHRAKLETGKHFGSTICMFTPLYIANYCENYCVYCGFNCHNKIHRGKLTMEEMEHEMSVIAKTGLREMLADRSGFSPIGSIPRNGLCWAVCGVLLSVPFWGWVILGKMPLRQAFMLIWFRKNILMQRFLSLCQDCGLISITQTTTLTMSTSLSFCRLCWHIVFSCLSQALPFLPVRGQASVTM